MTSIESKSEYKKTMNYLHYTLGYSISIANKIIKRYGINNHIKYPSNSEEENYVNNRTKSLNETGILIQYHWNDFMEFYGQVKEQYRNSPRKNTYIIKGASYHPINVIQ